jgi:hypothetical protein
MEREESARESMHRLEADLKDDRKKKYLIYGGIAAAVVALIIIIVAVSGGKKKPPKPDDKQFDKIYNPYYMSELTQWHDYSSRAYNLTLNSTLQKVGNYSQRYFGMNNYSDCKPIQMAYMKTTLVNNYNTLRIEFNDALNDQQYKVSTEYLNTRFDSIQDKELNFDEVLNSKFTVDINTNTNRPIN